ncbi:MAG: energy-coupled thiamine transporter ThiT [Candidatus Riflebacteria bacterium]|nr:energy-coupled thiamine transporter ThiT [Candidatus Riflebacteria bacterium]
MKKNLQSISIITEIGILIALAIVLGNFKLFQLPVGGSVSMASFPLILLAVRNGFKAGITGGIIFGFLSLIRTPFIVHPLQFLLDYPIACGSIGLSGFFRWTSGKNVFFSIVSGTIPRLLCHTIAGVVFFSKSGDTIQTAFYASFIYNCGHIIPEGIIFFLLGNYIRKKHPSFISA